MIPFNKSSRAFWGWVPHSTDESCGNFGQVQSFLSSMLQRYSRPWFKTDSQPLLGLVLNSIKVRGCELWIISIHHNLYLTRNWGVLHRYTHSRRQINLYLSKLEFITNPVSLNGEGPLIGVRVPLPPLRSFKSGTSPSSLWMNIAWPCGEWGVMRAKLVMVGQLRAATLQRTKIPKPLPPSGVFASQIHSVHLSIHTFSKKPINLVWAAVTWS